jgi:hypothetical protein
MARKDIAKALSVKVVNNRKKIRFEKAKEKLMLKLRNQLEKAKKSNDKKKMRELEIDIKNLDKMKHDEIDLELDRPEPDPGERPMTIQERTARRK